MGCMTFVTTCVGARGEDIIDMLEGSRDITRRTFLKHVDRAQLREIEKSLGYGHHLRMSKDWHVAYGKGMYRGKPCVFFRWSSIEHIFQLENA